MDNEVSCLITCHKLLSQDMHQLSPLKKKKKKKRKAKNKESIICTIWSFLLLFFFLNNHIRFELDKKKKIIKLFLSTV